MPIPRPTLGYLEYAARTNFTSSLRGALLGGKSGSVTLGIWSIGDQAVVSLGTFLTNLTLARSLPPSDYGTYAVLMSIMLFCNGLHSTLVTYPISIIATERDASAPGRLAGSALAITLILAVVFGGGTAVALAFIGRQELAWSALLALICWQAQETVRRVLMAGLRHRDVVFGDAISYLGQVVLLAGFSYNGWLSLENALALLACTSLGALVLQALQVRLEFASRKALLDDAQRYWQLGRWLLPGNLMSLLSVQAFLWSLAAFHGNTQAAVHQAITNLLGVSHLVMYGLGNVMIPTVARAHSEHGAAAAIRVGRRYGLQGLGLLLPYFVVLLVWPWESMRLVYGSGSDYLSFSWLLPLAVAAYGATYLAHTTNSLLVATKQTRAAFRSQATSTLVALILGLPLIAAIGVVGALLGAVLTATARATSNFIYLVRFVRHSSREQGIVL